MFCSLSIRYLSLQAGSEFSPVRDPTSPVLRLHDDDDVFSGGRGGEGFLCPSCMEAFQSPEELQVHYESRHASEAGLTTAKRSQGHLRDLQEEVDGLQSTLRQELGYSQELKKEVEKLSSAVAKGDETKEATEERMVREQLGAMEEAKQLSKRTLVQD